MKQLAAFALVRTPQAAKKKRKTAVARAEIACSSCLARLKEIPRLFCDPICFSQAHIQQTPKMSITTAVANVATESQAHLAQYHPVSPSARAPAGSNPGRHGFSAAIQPRLLPTAAQEKGSGTRRGILSQNKSNQEASNQQIDGHLAKYSDVILRPH